MGPTLILDVNKCRLLCVLFAGGMDAWFGKFARTVKRLENRE